MEEKKKTTVATPDEPTQTQGAWG